MFVEDGEQPKSARAEGSRQIAVLGAGGRTGSAVVRQAAARGRRVIALARRPLPDLAGLPGVRIARGDALDPGVVADAVAGCDAVVSALGVGSSRRPTRLYSGATTTILDAMAAAGTERLVVVSAAPVGPRDEQPRLERRLLMPILDRVFGETYADMRRMEALLEKSEVSWTVLRPPRLLASTATGRYRMSATGPLARGRSIRCGDLATALLDALELSELHRRAAAVAA